MKNFLVAAMLLLSFASFSQQRLLKFTKTNAATIVLNSDDIAFLYPASATTTTIVLGPSVHSVDVSEVVDSIVHRSYGSFQTVTEVQKSGATRTVAVSLSHISEVIPGTGSTTVIRMKSPTMNIVASGTFATVYPTLVGNPYRIITDTANFYAKPGLSMINHAATVATDTVYLPASPNNGDFVKLVYKTVATALVVSGNGKTIIGTAVTAAAAGSTYQYEYFGTADIWIRTQ